jgi:hypothetical protein
MKRILLGTILHGTVAIGLLTTGLTVAAAAQSAPQDTLPPVQPPPAMDAPAANAAAPAQAPPAQTTGSNTPVVPLANSDAEARAAAAAEAAATADRAKALNAERTDGLEAATAPPKVMGNKALDAPPLPPDVQKAAEATELPVVTVRQNGNERVEEYRKKGVLYFVRVVPPEGPPRYYVDNPSNLPPDIRQLSAPSGTVQPVYYKLLDWH